MYEDLFCNSSRRFRVKTFVASKWDRTVTTRNFSHARLSNVFPRLDLFCSLMQLKTPDSQFDTLECGRDEVLDYYRGVSGTDPLASGAILFAIFPCKLLGALPISAKDFSILHGGVGSVSHMINGTWGA